MPHGHHHIGIITDNLSTIALPVNFLNSIEINCENPVRLLFFLTFASLHAHERHSIASFTGEHTLHSSSTQNTD